MIKKFCLVLAVLLFTGCATVNIPGYIKDDHPHTHLIYADFDTAVAAVKLALNDMGWEVVEETDPTVYEHSAVQEEGGREILLFTDIKENRFVVGTKYRRINVYLRSTSKPKETEMELRYIAIRSVAFMKSRKYKHPKAAARIFKAVDDNL